MSETVWVGEVSDAEATLNGWDETRVEQEGFQRAFAGRWDEVEDGDALEVAVTRNEDDTGTLVFVRPPGTGPVHVYPKVEA